MPSDLMGLVALMMSAYRIDSQAHVGGTQRFEVAGRACASASKASAKSQ